MTSYDSYVAYTDLFPVVPKLININLINQKINELTVVTFRVKTASVFGPTLHRHCVTQKLQEIVELWTTICYKKF